MKKLFALFTALAALSAHGFAALIAFNPATTISGDSDVNTLGTLVAGFNAGASGVPSTTVNGVLFNSFALAGNPTTVGNYSLSETVLAAGLTSFGNTAYGSASAPFSNLSANYRTLLGAGIQSGISETMVLTLNSLTIGQVYLIEIWTNFSPTSISGVASPGVETVQGANGGNTVSLSQNTTSTAGGVGQFTTGTFLADNTSQAININATSGLPLISAFQVRAIPEPTTLALLATGGILGLLALRRRQ